MINRICSFIVGLFLVAFGVGFSILSMLGTTPISSIAYSLSLIFKMDVGICIFIFNVSLILFQFILLRSKFGKKRLLQFINCILFGYFIDISLYLLSFVPFDSSILMCSLYLALSIFSIALGIFIYMPANIASLPGEGCVEAVAIVTGWRFSTIKIGFDIIMVVISIIICGLWDNNMFAAVYIGTLISALMVGVTLRLISNMYTMITCEEVNVVNP